VCQGRIADTCRHSTSLPVPCAGLDRTSKGALDMLRCSSEEGIVEGSDGSHSSSALDAEVAVLDRLCNS